MRPSIVATRAAPNGAVWLVVFVLPRGVASCVAFAEDGAIEIVTKRIAANESVATDFVAIVTRGFVNALPLREVAVDPLYENICRSFRYYS